MSKFFPKLRQNQVKIDLDPEGKEHFMCPMLPVGKLSELDECSDALGKAETFEDVVAAKQKLIDLICTVLPPEYAANLPRFQVDVLSELAAYLMFGDDSDQPKAEGQPEKN